ncbi:MAG: CHAT domain-containing protein [Acidobacteriota bacterium]
MEVSGCGFRRTTPQGLPTCLLAGGPELKLWIRQPPSAELDVSLDGTPLDVSPSPLAGGLLVRWSEPSAGGLEILARRGGETAGRFRLRIESSPFQEFTGEVVGLVRGGGADEATRRVELRLSDGPTAERGPLLTLLARVEQAAGRPELARRHAEEAAGLLRSAGSTGAEIDARTLLVRLLYYDLGDFAGALRELADLPEPAVGDADARYLVDYYRGTLALHTGDLRSARRHLEAMGRQRLRLGDPQGRAMVTQMLARLARRVGRHDEALRLLDGLEADVDLLASLDACRRAQVFTNLGWDRLLALEAGREAGDPAPPLLRARQILEDRPRCPDSERATVEINLALTSLYRGEVDAGRFHLDRAAGFPNGDSPRLALDRVDVGARLDLLAGRAERALAAFEGIESEARRRSLPNAEWRGVLGRARSLEALGRRPEALDAYRRGEILLDEASLRTPVDQDRAAAVELGERGTRRFLRLLLDEGRVGEALEVARRARSRVLRGLLLNERLATLDLEQRARWLELRGRYRDVAGALEESLADGWRLPEENRGTAAAAVERLRREQNRWLDEALALLDAEGLTADPGPLLRRPGEVALVYHPLVEGWVAFAVSEGGTFVQRLPDLPQGAPPKVRTPEALAAGLLEPFGPVLAGASGVRVLTTGWLRGVDFHALPLRGEPLVARGAVVYGLDLPTAPAAGPGVGGTRALVVVDPTATLRSAPVEGSAVAGRLDALGFAVHRLAGAGVDRGVLGAALPKADLLHFAGHAESATAGVDGGLRLSSGARWSLGDLLTGGPVPGAVVLSTCHGGDDGAAGSVPSLGPAQAFLVAGSGEVVASVAAVEDGSAAALASALYRHWDGIEPLAEALRRAQLEIRAAGGDGWAGFRVFER